MDYPIEYLNTFNPSDIPHHQLVLKINAIIMLIRNLSTKDGLCNGMRLIVTGLYPNSIKAKIISGRY